MERPSHYPEASVSQASEGEGREDLVAAQAAYLRKTLKDLKLGYIPVRAQIHSRDVRAFANIKTVVVAGMSDIPVSLMVSGGTRKRERPTDTAVLMVAPTEDGAGFLTDADGKIYTDSFWLYEDGSVKYIHPSQPVPVDVVSAMYDGPREQGHFAEVNQASQRIFEVAGNKARTKELLEAHEIPVPNGIILQPDTDYSNQLSQLAQFMESTPTAKGYVAKTTHGAHGHGVVMFEANQPEELREYVVDFFAYNIRHEREEPLILEERIMPLPLESLKQRKYRISKGAEVDYNFRILVTLSKEPKAVDGEIRFKEDDATPVNITYEFGPANAALLDLLDDEQIEQLFRVAEDATKVIYDEGASEGAEEIEGALAGVDVMRGEDGFVVLEVNAGAGVGGFGTLTRLRRGQVPSVKEKLLPLWNPLLEKRFATRRTIDVVDLQRLPHNESDTNDLWSSYFQAQEYEKVQRLILEIGPRYEHQYYIVQNLMFLVSKTGDILSVYRYFQEGIKRGGASQELFEKAMEDLMKMEFSLNL